MAAYPTHTLTPIATLAASAEADTPPTAPASAASSSPRRQARPSRLPAMLARSPEAALLLQRDRRITDANAAAGALLGLERSEIVGMPCSEVLRCRDGRGNVLCETARCPLQQSFSAEGSAASCHDIQWGTNGSDARDVTASFTPPASRRSRAALVLAREQPPAQAASRAQANFLSMVSHELRTPLHTINGFLEIVLDGHTGQLLPQQAEFLTYARASTQQLTRLVEDILFISKADSGQFALRLGEVAIAALIEAVIQPLRLTAEQQHVRLTTHLAPDMPCLLADELRLQQVLTNLLSNALKFAPPDSTVTLEVSAYGTAVLFAVSDSGRGIPPQERTRIFERFYQAEGTQRAHPGGYGLGLAIARLIVEQHGGSIWVEDAPQRGARFCFTIPYAAERST